MRARLAEIGGTMERDARRGTRLTLVVPRRAGRRASDGRVVIRILIAEDQAMVLGALSALLEIESDLEVVGEARTGAEALALALKHHPDVVVTDIEMPGMTGLDLAAALREHERAPRVIILTTFARPGYLRRALDVGASGYLLKDAPSAQLADAIRRVAAGGRAIDPSLAAEAWTEPDPLDRPRTPGAAPGRRGAVGRRDRAAAEALGRDRPQLPVGVDRQARRPQSGGSRAHRTPEGVALSHGASSIALASDRFNHRWRPPIVAPTHAPLPSCATAMVSRSPAGQVISYRPPAFRNVSSAGTTVGALTTRTSATLASDTFQSPR